MLRLLLQSLRMVVVMTLVCGIAYPFAVTALAQFAFRDAANGSVLAPGGKVAGSALIGQPFDDPKYFWGRPSATSPQAYNGGASTGSNLGPTNPALLEAVKQRIAALRAADPGNAAPIPVDLVTASGSGLDPEISPAAARFQVARIARLRHLDARKVQALVDRATSDRTLGVLGEPRVNVLEANLALDGRW